MTRSRHTATCRYLLSSGDTIIVLVDLSSDPHVHLDGGRSTLLAIPATAVTGHRRRTAEDVQTLLSRTAAEHLRCRRLCTAMAAGEGGGSAMATAALDLLAVVGLRHLATEALREVRAGGAADEDYDRFLRQPAATKPPPGFFGRDVIS